MPDAGEFRFSRLLIACLLLIAAPVIGTGALNELLRDAGGELSNFPGESCVPKAPTEEDDISRGGPGTSTYSRSTNSNESATTESAKMKRKKKSVQTII